MSIKNAHVAVRQMCLSGVPGRLLLPALLPALRDVVAAESAAFFYVNSEGEMDSVVAERLLSVEDMTKYYEKYHAKNAQAFTLGFKKRAAAADPVSAHTFTASQRATPYFKDILQKLGADHILYAIIRDSRGPIGQLSLYRSDTTGFSLNDKITLRSVIHHLARALRDDVTPLRLAAPEASQARSEFAILNRDNQVVTQTAGFDAAIRVVVLHKISPQRATFEAVEINKVIAQLTNTESKDVKHLGFPNGSLTLRSLESAHAKKEGYLIEVAINSPHALAAISGAQRWRLSPQQANIAQLLSIGQTTPQIANALGVSSNTAAYHIKEIFAKLGVKRRQDVANKLIVTGN